jgi:predicted nucleic acid-binding protein
LSNQAGAATGDTNIVVYAFSSEEKTKTAMAALKLCSFLSVQVLNEYASVSLRKRRMSRAEIEADLASLERAIPHIIPVNVAANRDALRISERYRLSFYDSLMLAVALSGGAKILYSEDMQHGLVIDDTLRIVDPFR